MDGCMEVRQFFNSILLPSDNLKFTDFELFRQHFRLSACLSVEPKTKQGSHIYHVVLFITKQMMQRRIKVQVICLLR